MKKDLNEPAIRIIIDKMLRESGWILPGYKGKINVDVEVYNDNGKADYVLMSNDDSFLCVIEAKKKYKSPLDGKEQARGYAKALNCRFAILSNGFQHYFWDLEHGSPYIINQFPTQKQIELRDAKFNPTIDENEEIFKNYIALTQNPNFESNPDYLDEKRREEYLSKNKIRLLRDYQLEAVHSIQNGVKEGRERFLLEMATGTGKTLTSCAIIKMFLRLYKVNRVLFLVDRLELESQAYKEFDEILGNDFITDIWKANKSTWKKAKIVVSTVQSFIHKSKYKKLFDHDDFDLVISDEAHRSLGPRGRKVFEYFNGFKVGLTATPKNYLKSVDLDSLSVSDPRGLEERLLLDTYTTFGCDDGQPTFSYSLIDGVKDGYLVQPKLFDARSDITTDLLSKKGFHFVTVDDEGNDVEETYLKNDFEKKFFSQSTNRIFCETFLRKAKKDPYTGEIGKTLVFCVSQNHASRITQILNEMSDILFPGDYNSDFAVQVTSGITDSQNMTVAFRNNNLNGKSEKNPNYLSSKTRICVTVGMMTTGYDCTDLLNICLMRPIYSPSEFIQMKGRGTRKNNFKYNWISENTIPANIEAEKDNFHLFDFMANYEYFEEEFNFIEKLDLPKKPSISTGDMPTSIDEAHNYSKDHLQILEEIEISDDGMKVDRELYEDFRNILKDDKKITELVDSLKLDEAENYLKNNIFDKDNQFTPEKLTHSLGADRKISISELLLYSFDKINRIKSKKECLEEDFEKLDNELKPVEDEFDHAKLFFETYIVDPSFREIIESNKLVELNTHPNGDSFKNLSKDLREMIPNFIKEKVDIQKFEDI